MKNNKLAILLRGIIAENPVLILVLGTCPTLATTGNVISALRKAIPDTVRIPCYIVIIAGFVTALQMLLQAYLPSIYDMLGVYLALIVVNCIILGRAEMFARKNPVLDSVCDGLGMGIGFLVALLAMATIREVLGAGSFAGFEIPFLSELKVPILTQAPGGYLIFGILIAVMNKLTEKKGGVKKKSFSCESCPSAAACKGECGVKSEEKEDKVNA